MPKESTDQYQSLVVCHWLYLTLLPFAGHVFPAFARPPLALHSTQTCRGMERHGNKI